MSSPFPNPPVAVDALFVPMTPDIVNATIISTLVGMQIRADLWPQEGVLRSCMFAVARVISGFVNDGIAARKAGWLPTAFGNWLTWLAFYMYGVLRQVATFASGPLVLTNNAGGVFNRDPFTVSFQCSQTQQTYKNATAIALAAGPGTTQTITIQADVAGSVGNAPPTGVDTIVTPLRGVTCSNLVAILGIDQQSDPALQSVCWNAIAANSVYGAPQAIGYAVQTATNAVTGNPVNINRYRLSPSSHTGQATVVVASPSGAADVNDMIGVSTRIEAIARPPNVQIVVVSAVPVAYGSTATVYVRSTPGLAASDVQAAMVDALDAFFASATSNPIGGQTRTLDGTTGLFESALVGVITNAWPPRPTDPSVAWASSVFDVEGLVDLPLLATQVATDAMAVNVVLVAP